MVIDADTARWPEHVQVSRVVSEPGLPFFTGVLRGVVVDGRAGRAILYEAARVTAPRCRTVVVHAPAEAAEVLEEARMNVLASEGGTVVAARG